MTALVGRRLAALSPTEQRCLRAAAVCGTDPDWALLPQMLDEPEQEVLAAAQAATAAQLLRDTGGVLRWRHALIREAVLAMQLPPERRAVARRAGEALLARARPDDAAHAAELLAEGGDEERAAATFIALARHDRVHGALRRAEQLLDRAEVVGAAGSGSRRNGSARSP